MRRAVLSILLGLALAGGAIWIVFLNDLRIVNDRLASAAHVAMTRSGPVAFATGGAGPPVLALHGAGGGYDQGRLLAEAFLPEGQRWIAPSRFGYPGVPMPADSSTAAQADALAALLDSLGVDVVTVLAMSGGAPPALQFASRHPDRTQALVLLSIAPYAPLTAETQDLPVPLWLYDALFATDLPFWLALRVSPRALAPMFDARRDLIAQMTAAEAEFLDAMIAAFLPVTQRRAGLANEGAAIDPAVPIDPAGIGVPVLIVHARDDRLTPFSTARFTAERIVGVEFMALDTGGHLLLGHHAVVRRRIAEFLDARSGQPAAPAPLLCQGSPR